MSSYNYQLVANIRRFKGMDKAENYEAWQKITAKQKKEDLENEYFQIKAALFYIVMDKYGGRAGIVDKLSLARAESKNKNYEKASEQAKALLKLLDHNIFISQGPFQYVSISSKMEWAIYQHNNKSSAIHARNIHSVCPIAEILFRNGVIAYEMGDYSEAEKYFKETLKWNPVSIFAYGFLSLAYLELKQWNQCQTMITQALQYAYSPSHFRSFYGTLTLYFFCRKMNKDALCCNYLKMQYATSDEQRKIIAQDFQHFSKSESRTFLQAKRLCNAYIKSLEKTDKHNNKSEDKSNNMINVTIEDIHESSQKYGYPMEVNPEIIKLAQSCREEAITANDNQGAVYFDSILADWEKQKTVKNNILATKTQKDQKIVS